MPPWVFFLFVVVAIAVTAAFQFSRTPVEDDPVVRQRLEAQGLVVERVRPARRNVATVLREQYGDRRYVWRRFYDVLVKDGGVTVKQLWMLENDRLVRIS